MIYPTATRIRRLMLAGCIAALFSLVLAGSAMADQPSGKRSWNGSRLTDHVLGRRLLIGLVSYCKWRDFGFWVQRRDAFVPFCGLFISMSEGENIDFREVRPTDLQTNGKSILRKTARN